jgi:leucyl aminopeptidase
LPINLRLSALVAGGHESVAARAGHAGAGGEDEEDLAVAVPEPGAGTAGPDHHLGIPVAGLVSACGATRDAGDVAAVGAILDGTPRRVLLLGLGERSPEHLRKAGSALGARLTRGRRVLTSAAYGQPDEGVRAFAEGLLLSTYRFSLATRPPERGTGEVRLLVSGPGAASQVQQAISVAEAVAVARDLANTPSARKSPAWLAEEAVRVVSGSGVAARIWEPDELAAHGFGGLLAVGSGSARPPRLIELSYQPPNWREHIVLVGKGITFDSGGLSLKPNDGMKAMKTDMAGGAAVIAVMSALGRCGIGARVTGLVPAAENMPSGSALRPGDVITHFGGRTTEVLNTDAEGRLVLADALAYADAVLAPGTLVDLATLTGSARVALGTTIGALYASDDALAAALTVAGAESGEPLWRMPLVDDYTDALESPIADLANVPHDTTRTRAGSIEAALFLREFTGGRPWAHLDIAGAARSASREGEHPKGATGFGTRLLLRWLAAATAASPPRADRHQPA